MAKIKIANSTEMPKMCGTFFKLKFLSSVSYIS